MTQSLGPSESFINKPLLQTSLSKILQSCISQPTSHWLLPMNQSVCYIQPSFILHEVHH